MKYNKKYTFFIIAMGAMAYYCNTQAATTTDSDDIIGKEGDLTLTNLTPEKLYAGVYQYNYKRNFNTKVTFITAKPGESVKLAVPKTICIYEKTMFGKATSCDSHSRRRLFVSTVQNDNVLEFQQGFLDTAITQLDPSLWFAQVGADKTYVAFYNGFLFDPWYATEGKRMGVAQVTSRNQDAYLCPRRLNVIEKEKKRFDAVNRYVEFQNWITTK